MSVPYTFANQSASQGLPLSWIDSNFSYLTTSPTFTGNVTISANLVVNGNVGIGTTSPAQKLDVNGNIKASGLSGSFIGFADAVSHCMKYDTTLNGIKLNGFGAVVFETNGANERARIDATGKFLIGTTIAGASKLTVADDSIQINTAKTPSSATATGTQGQVCWDSNYVYVCVATNTWKRAALSTW